VNNNELRERVSSKLPEASEQVSRNQNESDKEDKRIEKKIKAGFLHKLCNYLFEQEDSSYIALFRMLWGLTMCYEIFLFVRDNFMKLIHHYYLNPYGWTFKYYLFEFVEVMPLDLMKIYTFSILIAAVFITIGLQYRFASIYFFFGISYLFLCESTHYLNHIYLVIVISFVMIFLPCNCCYSVDVIKRPHLYRPTLPKITLFFLRFFIIVVYTYAGIVKINEDWLRGEPLRHWVGRKPNAYYGELLTRESAIYLLSYGGMIYDLIVGPLLLWGPTFWIGIAATLFFHISNKLLFNIGIFPYLMIASTSLFFSPWTFRRILFKLRRPFSKFEFPKTISFSQTHIRKITTNEKVIIFFVVIFVAFWVLFPIRHYAYPGYVVWNEQGHVFSWRMKLRDKGCFGSVYGYHPLLDLPFSVPIEKTLSRIQAVKVFSRPWLFVQYAHFLGDLYAVNDTRAEIYTYWYCTVNYRPRQLFADPTIDYASTPKWDYYPWITELDPLPAEAQSQYPWNWEWNFNWLKGIDQLTMPGAKEFEDEEKQFRRDINDLTIGNFTQFIADKHFGGNVSAVHIEDLLVKGTNLIARDFWRAYSKSQGVPMDVAPPDEKKPKLLDEL